MIIIRNKSGSTIWYAPDWSLPATKIIGWLGLLFILYPSSSWWMFVLAAWIPCVLWYLIPIVLCICFVPGSHDLSNIISECQKCRFRMSVIERANLKKCKRCGGDEFTTFVK